MSQVATLQQFYEDHHDTWGDVQLLVINQANTEGGLEGLTTDVTLPVLQDTSDAQVFQQYGASKWYMYFIDPTGELRFVHYEMNVPNEEARILDHLAELQGGG